MLDFTIAMNKYAKVAIEDFTNKIDKRRLETMKGKSQIAIDMVKRAVNSGIYADYLLVDSWYSKPVFIKEMNELGLKVISRISNNNKVPSKKLWVNLNLNLPKPMINQREV